MPFSSRAIRTFAVNRLSGPEYSFMAPPPLRE
jgi:hypothetical protein